MSLATVGSGSPTHCSQTFPMLDQSRGLQVAFTTGFHSSICHLLFLGSMVRRYAASETKGKTLEEVEHVDSSDVEES